MSKKKTIKSAIVCAYHPAEDDLENTTKSAMASAGKGAKFYAVCDKDESGPGSNRNRGIEAATDAEVIVIIDAHMRFQGKVLAQMVEKVARDGGLLVPFCHHNAECSFDGNGGHYYAGARIVFKARDGFEFKPLDAKWSRDNTPGERGCVMGACYVFRRDWYMTTAGQPLAILNGWGCDEQVLSIAAWMTDQSVEVFPGHVAHRWRPRPPWQPSRKAIESVAGSRIAMIQSFVTDATDRRELLSWMSAKEPDGHSPAVQRLRHAMLASDRTWRQWKSEVCEAEELDGKQASRPSAPRTASVMHTPNIRVPRHGIQCPHCKIDHDSPRVTNTYPNGNKRHICPSCGNPFMSFPAATASFTPGNN